MRLDEGGLDQTLSPTTDINQVNKTVTQPATQNQTQKGKRAASASQPGPPQTPKKQKKTRDDNPKQPRAATSNPPAGKHLAFVKLIVKDLDEIEEWQNASLLALDEKVNLDSMQPVRSRNGLHCFTLSFRNADDLNNCLNLRYQFPVEVAGVTNCSRYNPSHPGSNVSSSGTPSQLPTRTTWSKRLKRTSGNRTVWKHYTKGAPPKPRKWRDWLST
jgi:hypothetical protein